MKDAFEEVWRPRAPVCMLWKPVSKFVGKDWVLCQTRKQLESCSMPAYIDDDGTVIEVLHEETITVWDVEPAFTPWKISYPVSCEVVMMGDRTPAPCQTCWPYAMNVDQICG